VGAAMARALAMPLAERKSRHKQLFETLLKNDISLWGDRFLSALNGKPLTSSSSRRLASRGLKPAEAANPILPPVGELPSKTGQSLSPLLTGALRTGAGRSI
jgi:hypothetical protein